MTEAPLLKRILIATDLKQGNEIAFRRAIQLSQSSGAALYAMHVLDRPFHPSASIEGAQWREQIPKKLQEFFRQHSKPNAAACVVHIEERGDVPDAIVKRALSARADLIVIGRSTRPNVLPDSVFLKTGQILSKSPIPVLIALTDPTVTYRHVLLEGDLSVSPTQVLRMVRELGFNGQLKLLVKSGVEICNPGLFGRILNTLQRRRKRRYLASSRLVFESGESNADHVSIVFVSSDLDHELFANLTDTEIDLTCMIGIRGKLRQPNPKTHLIAALQVATCDVLATPI